MPYPLHCAAGSRERERGERRGNRALNDTHAFERPVRSLSFVRHGPPVWSLQLLRNQHFAKLFFPPENIYIYISMVNGGSTHVGRFSISGVIRTVRGEPRALVSWQSGGGISGRLLRNARTKLLLGYFPYCSPCALVFLPRFFVSSALMIFHVGTVLYRDLNGAADALVVKFSRRTVCRIWHTLVTVLPMCNSEERDLSWFENRN